MKSILYILPVLLLFNCSEEAEDSPKVDDHILDEKLYMTTEEGQEKLSDAYQLFREGKDEESIAIANEVLEFGRSIDNDTLIGGALASLCRTSQRDRDTNRLNQLSQELVSLGTRSGNYKWIMIMAHQNAEMCRLNGQMYRAEKYYDLSMKISDSIGATGMFMIDHFNKSFVATATGRFEMANDLIAKYYQLRQEAAPEEQDPYGLIALSYLLEQQDKYEEAHEVALTARKLFKEQNIFPEPPDEKPLLAVEERVKDELDPKVYDGISAAESVNDLLEKYIQ